MLYSIIDIETTGGGVKGNKITEIAIIRHDGNDIVDEFQTLVNPEKSIPYRIQQLTGITNDMVRTAPKFYEIAKEVLLKIRDTVFVAHNVSFDYNVVRHEYTSLGADFKAKRLCTVRLSRKAFPGIPSYSLGNLCSSLGIEINNRHRAYGDALATARLFERILEQDGRSQLIDEHLNIRNRETSLPPHLPKSSAERLPDKTGVYYFKDRQGKTIYVGKAKNIRQRVFSHFYSKTRKELNMRSQIHDIGFEITGSEIVALLHESAEIKRLYPKFNRSQRRDNANIKVFSYIDNAGIRRLAYGDVKAVKDPLRVFTFPVHARNFLEALKEEYELCPKFCGLQQPEGPCFDYHLKKCRGACAGKESPSRYNRRVEAVMDELNNTSAKIALLEPGKEEGEQAIVLMENGIYLGYGFIKTGIAKKLSDFESCKKFIQKQKHNNDTIRIINQYLRIEHEGITVMEF